MAKINILPSKVYNRIAAGEVVDRPCSVVKELVENAIDAGATDIKIYIEQGGKQLIRVEDNGVGIEREDLHSAFLPHATSKISQAEDLENITTLGFRGEAVASISAVSKMTIRSKTVNGKRYKLSCDGGELGQIEEVAGENVGTDVSVETLFYHTPVRLGFLKSDKVEETEITNFVSRFILNRSDIAFTYYVNGKQILQSYGEGDESAMACVYGASVLSECFCIDANKHGIRIRGYIGGQNFYKANKSYQSVFLNGRYIVNATISAALSNAYGSYLMKRQYPFYVLHIDMPSEIVDVNVHPNKSDVRFADNQIVYGSIYNVVTAVLDGQPKGLEYIVKMPTKTVYEEEQPAPVSSWVEEFARLAEKTKEPAPSFTYEDAKKELEESAPVFTAKKRGLELPFEGLDKEPIEGEKKQEKAEEPKYPKGFTPYKLCGGHGFTNGEYEKLPEADREDFDGCDGDLNRGAKKLLELFPKLKAESDRLEVQDSSEDSVFEQNKKFLAEWDRAMCQSGIDVGNFVYVGKLFNTYLLYEYENNTYIIDQHAAHERIIFDRLKKQMQEKKVVRQPMLACFLFPTNAFEAQFIKENYSKFDDIGITIRERQENLFEISEIPMDLIKIDLNSFMHDLLSEINDYRAIKLEELQRDKLASKACKAAVKGGMDLTREEMDKLLFELGKDMTLKCPHGRPIIVRLSKVTIEKMFKRIV